MDGNMSTRQLTGATGVNRTNVQLVLKKYKFQPYKIHLVQKQKEDDFDSGNLTGDRYLDLLQNYH